MRWTFHVATTSMVAGLAAGALLSADSFFDFDGTTSDLSQQLYRRYLAGNDVDQVEITEDNVPKSIQSRLTDANITTFSSLPGIVQRALLWDSGYVFGADGSLKQVWPLDNHSMANIAVPYSDFLESGCTAKDCNQTDGKLALSNHFCSGTQMLSVSRCVVEDDDGEQQDIAMWATGGSDTMIPELRLLKHEWDDYLVFSINTLSADAEPKYDQCPSGGFGSVVIPCHPKSTYPSTDDLVPPEPTAWVDEWLLNLSLNATELVNDTITVEVTPAKGMFDSRSTNSDIARQLYDRYQAGDRVDPLGIDKVPDRVLQRLKDLDVTFDNIDPIAQRALLWDSGYAITGRGEVKQVWLLPERLSGENSSMAHIGVSLDEYISISQCTTFNCPQPDGNPAYYSQYCNGVQMLLSAKCVMEDPPDEGDIHSPMWTTGGDTETAIPEVRAVMHSWEVQNTPYLVCAIHTFAISKQAAYEEQCTKANEGYGALTIPCHPLSTLGTVLNANKVEPTPSDWVDTWMKEFQTEDQRSKTAISTYIGVSVGSVAAVVLLIAWCIYYRRRRENGRLKDSNEDNSDRLFDYVGMAQCDRGDDSTRPTVSTLRTADYRPSHPGLGNANDMENGSSAGLQLLPILRDDPNLTNKRIPYKSLDFKRMLSNGSFGEVWLCNLTMNESSQEVAVKRLIEGKTHNFEAVQDFANEIQLSASLRHPNIVEFIGVAWSTLSNLVLVMEFLPTGDLLDYLSKDGDIITWYQGKGNIVAGITQAIDYLHSLDPPLIHRDIKSKNVLLTQYLSPKIVDFGITRRRVEETMTAGVGTPYWTAPEVLSGHRYTEQSDIYSFGVLLSEIDTRKLPYHDAVGPTGAKLKPFQVLDGVMSGNLRPSFREDCPTHVRHVGIACMEHDPSRRPSAKQLVKILAG